MTVYGSFPGIRVETGGGGITAVSIGDEEKIVIFGEAEYQDDGSDSADSLIATATGTPETPEQINGRIEADEKFGADSELAQGLREALSNGANIDYLYGVAVNRIDVDSETQTLTAGSTGTLDNAPITEDVSLISTDDSGNPFDIEFRYNGAPATPTGEDELYINPLTGEYAVTSGTVNDAHSTIGYKYPDWDSAFSATDVQNVVNENETGIYVALSDSDAVSINLHSEISTLRTSEYKLISGLSGAEPNDNSSETPPDAQYDTANYGSANQSIDSDFYFKVAPARVENEPRTILGGVGGLFAGNSISNPVYNDALNGYQGLEQEFTRTDANNLRNNNIIPVRQAGSIRVEDNLSTSTETDWERDFFRRRITDRVVLIGKTVGDAIIGRVNNEDTRFAAERLISAEIRGLVDDGVLKPNTADTTNWFVEVYEDSTNSDQVNIDIGITPYGVVKRIDESVTINT